jgi:O-antigen/teichoic acid export membrane protein
VPRASRHGAARHAFCWLRPNRAAARNTHDEPDAPAPDRHQDWSPDMLAFLKEVTKHTSIYGMGGMATKVIGFFLLPLYTHYLTPADYGVLGLLYITMRVLDIVVIQGMTTSIFRAYSFDYRGDPKNQAEAVRTAYYYSVGSALLLFGFLSMFAGPLNDLVFKAGEWTHLFRLMFLAGIFRATQNIPRQIMRAHRKSTQYSLIQLGDFVSAALLNVYFIVYAKQGLAGIVYSEVIREGALMIVFFFPIRSYLAKSFSKSKLWEMLCFGLPKVPGGLSFLVLSASDRYFLEHYSTATELGLYSVGYRLATLLSDFAIQPFMQTWPSMYFPLAKDSKDEGKEVLGRFLTYFMVVVGFMALGICVFVKPLLHVMADPQFHGAERVVPLVVLALLFSGLYRVITVGVNIKKKNYWLPIMVASAAVINIVFNALLIPKWGMMGAAWATVIAYAVMCLASYIVDEYYFPIRYEWGRVLRVAVAVGMTYATSVFVTPDHFVGQLAAGCAMLLLYPALLGVLGFYNAAELKTLRRLANQEIRLGRRRPPLAALAAPAAAPEPTAPPAELVGAATGVERRDAD